MKQYVVRRRLTAAFALVAVALGLVLAEARHSSLINVAGEADYLALNPEQE